MGWVGYMSLIGTMGAGFIFACPKEVSKVHGDSLLLLEGSIVVACLPVSVMVRGKNTFLLLKGLRMGSWLVYVISGPRFVNVTDVEEAAKKVDEGCIIEHTHRQTRQLSCQERNIFFALYNANN